MREWIKRGGGERKEGWDGVKRFSFFVIMINVFSIVCSCLMNFKLLFSLSVFI